MQEAAAAGARLVHSAEGALSGYAKSQITSRDWSAFDWNVLRQELETTAALARKLGIWVAIGSAHRLSPPHRPHNSLYIVSDRGKVVDRYDKSLLSNSEITDWYTPGFEPTVLDVDGIRLGCAICIEVQFAEVFDEYRRLGVDGVLLSAYPPDDDPMFQITARAHASVNNLWISFAVPANIGGRLAGFPIGTPMDTTFAYGTNPSQLRDRYYEAHDLIMRAWTEKDTFAFNGRLNQQRYVNVWPRPVEEPSADLDSRRRLGGDVARL